MNPLIPVPALQDSQVSKESHANVGSIPATLVVKSDGSLMISSESINNPAQLVMMPNAEGKTNLYMIPKGTSSSQTAFLVKPMDGQNWKIGQTSFSPTDNIGEKMDIDLMQHTSSPLNNAIPTTNVTVAVSTVTKTTSTRSGVETVSATAEPIIIDCESPVRPTHPANPTLHKLSDFSSSCTTTTTLPQQSFLNSSEMLNSSTVVAQPWPTVVQKQQNVSSYASILPVKLQEQRSDSNNTSFDSCEASTFSQSQCNYSSVTADPQYTDFEPPILTAPPASCYQTAVPSVLQQAVHTSSGVFDSTALNTLPRPHSTAQNSQRTSSCASVMQKTAGIEQQSNVAVSKSRRPSTVTKSLPDIRPSVNKPLVILGSHGSTATTVANFVSAVKVVNTVQSNNSPSLLDVNKTDSPNSGVSDFNTLKPIALVAGGSGSARTSITGSLVMINGKIYLLNRAKPADVTGGIPMLLSTTNMVTSGSNSITNSAAMQSSTLTSPVMLTNSGGVQVNGATSVIAAQATRTFIIASEQLVKESKPNTVRQMLEAKQPITTTVGSTMLKNRNVVTSLSSTMPSSQSLHYTKTPVKQHQNAFKSVASKPDSSSLTRTTDSQTDVIDVDPSTSDNDDSDLLPDNPCTCTSSAVDSDVRPMFLFRNDIARKMKPAALQEVSLASCTSAQETETTGSKTTRPNNTPVVFSLPQSTISATRFSKLSLNGLNQATNVNTSGIIKNDAPALVSLSTKESLIRYISHGKQIITSSHEIQTNRQGTAPIPKVLTLSRAVGKETCSASQALKHIASISGTAAKTSTSVSQCFVKNNEGTMKREVLVNENGQNIATFRVMNFERKESNMDKSHEQSSSLSNTSVQSTAPSSNNLMYSDLDGESNESNDLRIDSVFSLNPSSLFTSEDAQPNKKFAIDILSNSLGADKDTHDQPSLNKCSSNETPELTIVNKEVRNLGVSEKAACLPNFEVLGPPSKNTRQSTREPDETKVSEGNQKHLSELLEKQEVRTRCRNCRVVLRCLNIKKFKTPYSYASINRELMNNTCTKKCRKLAVRVFYGQNAERSQTVLPSWRLKRYIPYVKIRSLASDKLPSVITEYSTDNDVKAKSNSLLQKPLQISAAVPNKQTVNLPRSNVFHNYDKDTLIGQLSRVRTGVVTETTAMSTALSTVTSSEQNKRTLFVSSVEGKDKPKHYVYNIGGKSVLIPTSSFQNAFALTLMQNQSTGSNIETRGLTMSVSVTNTATRVNRTEDPVFTSTCSRPVVSTHLTPSVINQCISGVDPQNVRVKSEPHYSEYTENLEPVSGVVNVKPEPVACGYSDDTVASVISRKRKISGDGFDTNVDKSVEDAGGQEPGTAEFKPFKVSVTPHTERIRRLKEMVKQKKEALEEMRKNRFSC